MAKRGAQSKGRRARPPLELTAESDGHAIAVPTAGAAAGPDTRYQMIAEAAYYRAERRGFAGGDPVRDWLEAEAEVSVKLGSADSSARDRLPAV